MNSGSSRIPRAAWWGIAANIVPLASALAFGWSLGEVFLVFWLENLAFCLFLFAKVLSKGRFGWTWIHRDFLNWPLSIVLHGAVVFALFVDRDEAPSLLLAVAPSFVALIAAQGRSFFQDWMRGGERDRTSLSELYEGSLPRMAGLHMALFAAGWAIRSWGIAQPWLGALIAIKALAETAFVLQAHHAHRGAGRENPGIEGSDL